MKHKCDFCKKIFIVRHPKKLLQKKKMCCSRSCAMYLKGSSKIVQCTTCDKEIIKNKSQIQRTKSKLPFCSKSCGAKYNNKIRINCIRSKSEKLLFDLLVSKFPNLTFIPNDRLIFDGLEADIYIPSLNIAIEWNGIIHFQPIFGLDTLNLVKTRDFRKQIIAKNKKIDLITISAITSNNKFVEKIFNELVPYIELKLNQK